MNSGWAKTPLIWRFLYIQIHFMIQSKKSRKTVEIVHLMFRICRPTVSVLNHTVFSPVHTVHSTSEWTRVVLLSWTPTGSVCIESLSLARSLTRPIFHYPNVLFRTLFFKCTHRFMLKRMRSMKYRSSVHTALFGSRPIFPSCTGSALGGRDNDWAVWYQYLCTHTHTHTYWVLCFVNISHTQNSLPNPIN